MASSLPKTDLDRCKVQHKPTSGVCGRKEGRKWAKHKLCFTATSMLEPTGASSEKPGQYLTGRRSSYWDTIQRASGHSAQEWVCFCPWPAMLRLFPVWFACAAFESAHESNHREGNDSLHGRRRHTAEWSMPGRTVAVLLVVGMIGEEQHDGAEWVWGRRGTATEKVLVVLQYKKEVRY